MEEQSFVNYFREWWHFDSEEPGTRRLDVAIGC
jgi:D-alanyl-D-alanine dipeptidase